MASDETKDLTADLQAEPSNVDRGSELASWVMSRVARWRTSRDSTYQKEWNRFYDIWRGKWDPTLKTKQVERSKLIAPATQQAVDATVAEMVEATFGRSSWFDCDEYGPDDPAKQDAAIKARDQLLEDFDKDAVPSSIRETYVLGAIYGTGIAKLVVTDKTDTYATAGGGEQSDVRVAVEWEAVPPYNFVIDTSARTIDEALGVAHETIRPMHEIVKAQQTGEYEEGVIGGLTGDMSAGSLQGPDATSVEVDPQDGVYITEYHGLVPRYMLEDTEQEEGETAPPYDQSDSEGEEQVDKDEDYVEAIVTIANGGTLLQRKRNPYLTNFRGFVAYQHDTVPNTFWGRGVCEKAYNAQAALDAELRARIDALGLFTYPVMGIDATRIPRNLSLKVEPGANILTQGRPSEVIEPIKFGNLDPSTFQHSSDLERMVQMATGAFDSATPVNINSRNDTASGVSMQMGSMIKRAKLTMQNVDQDFLDPLVQKSYLAYMTYAPDRYPDPVDFVVNSTMSIMAREFEQTQMTNLLAIVPQESPAFLVILRGIVENYSGPQKDKILTAIEDMMKPDEGAQQQQAMLMNLQVQAAQAELMKILSEVEKNKAETTLTQAKTKTEIVKAALEDDKVEITAAQTVIEKRKTDIQEKQLAVQAAKVEVDREKVKADKQKAKSDGKSGSKSTSS